MSNKLKFLLGLIAIVTLPLLFALQDAPTSHETYCEIMGTNQFLSSKLTITVDYGKPTKWFTDTRIKSETGQVQQFNSMIDACNYMAEHGWEFVCAFPVTTGSSNVYHYTFRKTVTEE